MNINDEVKVIVRLSPSGDEFDVELPLYTSGKELLSQLIQGGYVPAQDGEGNPYVYQIMSKDRGSEVTPDKTLFDLGVKENEILLIMPKLVAG